MQFIAPTLQFFIGIGYGEALSAPRLICFGCIWCAVALFSADALRHSRRRQVTPTA